MKLRRLTAALLAAGMIWGAAVPAHAATTNTATVAYLESSSTKAWDGKSALKEGVSYTVSKNITVSSAVTIPKKAIVTVKKGAKLTIAEKGSITVNGTLLIQKKGSIAIDGKLTVNSGKVFQCSGTMTFGKKAVAKFNGRFFLLDGGKASGTPSKVTFGKTSSIVMAGTNNCKKMQTAVQKNYASLLKASSTKKVSAETAKKELAEHYNKQMSLIINDKACLHAINSVLSPADIDTYSNNQAEKYDLDPNKVLFEMSDSIADGTAFVLSLGNVSSAKNVKSLKMTITNAADCTDEAGVRDALRPRFGEITQCWLVDTVYNFTMKDGTQHKTTGGVAAFVYAGGNVYIVSEDLQNAQYK